MPAPSAPRAFVKCDVIQSLSNTFKKEMDPDLVARRRLRNQGVIWICFAPIFVTMAMISSVRPPTTYYFELIAFSLVALAGLVCGIGALSYRRWAARGLVVLTWIVGVYFLGALLLMLAWSFFAAR